MIGTKERDFKTYAQISLEDLVPTDNFYRQLEAYIDLEFIRPLVQGLYSNIGRPSIDPIVFFKLQLIAFFEDIHSERQLMEMVNLNLAHRWHLGYDLDEVIPDHSSLSKIRERYGLSVFQMFFEKIVAACVEAGLVWGKELYFDSTKVLANAAINNMITQAEFEAEHHLEQLFPSNEEDASSFSRLVDKYDGKKSFRDSKGVL